MTLDLTDVPLLDEEDVARQRAIENRIVAALTALGYEAPLGGVTKLIDAMGMIAAALEDMEPRMHRLAGLDK